MLRVRCDEFRNAARVFPLCAVERTGMRVRELLNITTQRQSN